MSTLRYAWGMNGRSAVTIATFAAGIGVVACAGRTLGPDGPAASSATPTAVAVEPPPLAAAQAATAAADPGAARKETRRQIFVAAWTLVRDKHFDKSLGGVDWAGLRAKYEPLAVGAPNEATFYRLLNEMLGALGQSHLEVSGPGSDPNAALDEAPPAPTPRVGKGESPPEISGGIGDPGLTVRVIEGRPTITAVRPGSAALAAGLVPGLVVTHIGGREIKGTTSSTRPLRPVEERFRVRLAAARRLSGPVGTRITVRYLDLHDRAAEAILERDPPTGNAVQVGMLPPLVPEVRVSQVGNVGIIAFNFFLLDPILARVKQAIEGFRARGAHGLILDLRGNPGGFGGMALPIAAQLVDQPLTLGAIQYRDFANTLTATPSLGVLPFLGRVVILTDEGTASTSEILAAGLQEAKRAVIVGETTLGAVLGSVIEALPAGAIIQLPVADFRTPRGVTVEGKGVQPDRRVIETRMALRTGRDPVLDVALVAAQASGAK